MYNRSNEIANLSQRHPLFVVVDIGTTRVKAALFDDRGVIFASSSIMMPLEKNADIYEIRPVIWLDAVASVIRDISSKNDCSDVVGLCISGAGPTLVALDAKMLPVRNAISWMDWRAADEANEISALSGKSVDASWLAAKFLWMKRSETDLFEKTAFVMQPLDYVAAVFTGEPGISIVSETFNAVPEDIWLAAGLPSGVLPRRFRMGEVIGKLSGKWASFLGLPSGVAVVAGTGGADVVEVLLGTALFEQHIVCDKSGTSEGLEMFSERKVELPGMFIVPHPFVAGAWHIGGMMSSGGKALEWFLRSFYPKTATFEDLSLEAETVEPGCGGLVFLPYLFGERTPVWDRNAKGVFFGLSVEHERRHMARAVMEGVAFGMSQIIGIFSSGGLAPKEIVATGKPSSNFLWNQIKADVSGLPLKTTGEIEAELLGLSIITSNALGLTTDLVETSRRLVRFDNFFYPSKEYAHVYRKNYYIYSELYSSLKKLFHS